MNGSTALIGPAIDGFAALQTAVGALPPGTRQAIQLGSSTSSHGRVDRAHNERSEFLGDPAFRTLLAERTTAPVARAARMRHGNKKALALLAAPPDGPERLRSADLSVLARKPADILVSRARPSDLPLGQRTSDEAASVAATALHELKPGILALPGQLFSVRTHAFIGATEPFLCRVLTVPPWDHTGIAVIVDEELTIAAINGHRQVIDPGEDITEILTQRSGRFRLETLSSLHIVDLDAGTWERIPGPHARHPDAALSGKIRTLNGAAIGHQLHITVYTEEPDLEYRWAISTPITGIERAGPPAAR